jgi:DnaJ-class molecular chaperone
MMGLVSCDSCDGCGKVTNDVHRIPWIWHTRELKTDDGVPLFSEVQSSVCNKCGGKGRIPRHMVRQFGRKKKYS